MYVYMCVCMHVHMDMYIKIYNEKYFLINGCGQSTHILKVYES